MKLNEALETLSQITLTDIEKNGGEENMMELKSRQLYLLGVMVSDFWDNYQNFIRMYLSDRDTDSSIVLYLGSEEENHNGEFRPQVGLCLFDSGKTIPETFATEVYTLSRRFVFTGKHKEEDCFSIFLDKIVYIIKGYTKAELIKIIG